MLSCRKLSPQVGNPRVLDFHQCNGNSEPMQVRSSGAFEMSVKSPFHTPRGDPLEESGKDHRLFRVKHLGSAATLWLALPRGITLIRILIFGTFDLTEQLAHVLVSLVSLRLDPVAKRPGRN